MTPEQAAAWVISQTACACAELGAMEAANDLAKHSGQPPKYDEEHFRAVPRNHGIGCNDVATIFQEANNR